MKQEEEKEEKAKVTLVILNITSWAGQCSDATHVYGNLILCDKPEVTIDNVDEWNVKHVGENIELRQLLTLEFAKKLDAKDGGETYQRHYRYANREGNDYPDEYRTTDKLDNLLEVENFAIAKWRELNLGCPFISLYEGEKYNFKDTYTDELCKTKILDK